MAISKLTAFDKCLLISDLIKMNRRVDRFFSCSLSIIMVLPADISQKVDLTQIVCRRGVFFLHLDRVIFHLQFLIEIVEVF